MNTCARLLLLASLSGVAAAQRVSSAPATDSSAQASPVAAPPKVPAVDSSAEASPAPTGKTGHSGHLAAGAAVHVSLAQGIDSGAAKNGQTVAAKLLTPVKTSAGTTLPAGTPVTISVISTVPAGKITAMGEMSLEAVRVGSIDVDTDIRTYRGQEGKREVADAVPALGTNAGLAAGAEITFHVAGDPQPATSAPRTTAAVPGSVNGKASGSPAAAKSSNSGEPTFGSTSTH